MNTEIKSLLLAVFAIIKVIEDAAAKKDFVTTILPDLYLLATDVPAITSNWKDLVPELKALAGADADADLVAFVISQVPAVASDVHAQKIIAASLDWAVAVGTKTEALIAAIKG